MLSKTIGQLTAATSMDDTDYVEIEHVGASYRATLQQIANFATPCGAYVDMAYEKTVSETFPAVALWESDKTLSSSNYPILVPELRAAVASVTLTAGTVVTSIDVNATAGSVLSSVNSAFTIIAAAIVEEYALQSAYSICVTIGGNEYTITSASSTITISGTIATGATTLSVYPHRIVGTSESAIVFKDSGRALLSHDGKTYLLGFRRRDRSQGYLHTIYNGSSAGGSLNGISPSSRTTNTGTTMTGLSMDIVTDGVNGTPRIGPTTDPNSSIVYRYLWAQEYLP